MQVKAEFLAVSKSDRSKSFDKGDKRRFQKGYFHDQKALPLTEGKGASCHHPLRPVGRGSKKGWRTNVDSIGCKAGLWHLAFESSAPNFLGPGISRGILSGPGPTDHSNVSVASGRGHGAKGG